MELDSDERELKAAGAEPLDGGRLGLRIRGWEIESRKLPILNCSLLQQYTSVSLVFLIAQSVYHFNVASSKL